MTPYSADTRAYSYTKDHDQKQKVARDNADVVFLATNHWQRLTNFKTQYERDGDGDGQLWEVLYPGASDIGNREAFCNQKMQDGYQSRDELLAQLRNRYVLQD